MATKLILKKWGNSIAAIFPKEFVVKKHLKENQKIMVEVVKEADVGKLFGSLERKLSGQEFKDKAREGWN